MKKITKIRIRNIAFLGAIYAMGISVVMASSGSRLDTKEGRAIGVLIAGTALILFALVLIAATAYRKTKRLSSIGLALKEVALALISADIFAPSTAVSKGKSRRGRSMGKAMSDRVAIRLFEISSVSSLLIGLVSLFVFGWLSIIGFGFSLVFVSNASHGAIAGIRHRKAYLTVGIVGAIVCFVNMMIVSHLP